MIPIKGMTTEPLYLPEMLSAWLGLVHWAIGNDEILQFFKEETKIDLKKLSRRSPIEKMIDESTGFERDCFIKFLDWVTENIWGLNE